MAESCRRILEIEIPQEVVKKRAEKVAGEFQRHARLPGFRPGKAPLSIVKQRFRDDIRSELLHHLVPEYVAAQAKDRKWDLVGNPSVTDVEYAEDSPLKFKATLEVMPEFELKDYTELEIEVEDAQVGDEEVENTLRHLQEEAATYVNVDEVRPLQDGDYATIAVTDPSASADMPAGKPREVLCEIGGERTLPEFTENLRGAAAGEERNISVHYPGDSHDPASAGKTVAYNVKVLGIKKKSLPELNDEFARELGDFDSIEVVRKNIREDIGKAKQRDSEQNAKTQLREKLAGLHDFSVPDVLVESQIEKRVEALRRQLDAKGMDAQVRQLDWGRLRASQHAGAEIDVKSTLLLEKIASANQIEVDAAEVTAEVQKLAAASRQSPEAIEAYLTREGGLDRIKSRLRIEKALDLAYQNVKRITKTNLARGEEV